MVCTDSNYPQDLVSEATGDKYRVLGEIGKFP